MIREIRGLWLEILNASTEYMAQGGKKFLTDCDGSANESVSCLSSSTNRRKRLQRGFGDVYYVASERLKMYSLKNLAYTQGSTAMNTL